MTKQAELADSAGVALTFWQIILMLALGEHLAQMWTLILNLQILAYVGKWQISYPFKTKLLLQQIKRLVLGEVLDDSKIGEVIIEGIGIEVLNWSPTEE